MMPVNPVEPTCRFLSLLAALYGAGALTAQVLILREILVLSQGQEIKLAMGLWCWLWWTGLGSFLGGWLAGRRSGGAVGLAALLAAMGWLLPATLMLARFLPSLGAASAGQTLGPGAALLLFLWLLAPFCLVSGCFFPWAVHLQGLLSPAGGAAGRVYALETLGGAAGILVLQVFLLGRFPALALSLGWGLLLNLAALACHPPRRVAGRLLGGLSLTALTLALLVVPQLEQLSRQGQWPRRQVAAAVDSPYAQITVTREAEQFSFYLNNLWNFTYPDPYSAETAVHLGLLQHPQPRRVLLLGGGPAGLAPEILKTPDLTHLTCVELDPHLVRLAQNLLPGAAGLWQDQRVELVQEDARRFLSRTGERYDVILMVLPEPTSAQLNRFYTREFFALAAGHLTPGGLFSFSLGGAATSLSPLRAAYLALASNTLAEAFAEVVVFPGERTRFFAARSPGVLTTAAQDLVARLKERRLELKYVREYYLLNDLAPHRHHYLEQVLARQPVEVNTDLNPRSYFYDLALTGAQEKLPLSGLLQALRPVPGWYLGAGAGLAGLLLMIAIPRRGGGLYLTQVMLMAAGAMALEILALIVYQVFWGSLYQEMGFLMAAFMAGMGWGGVWGVRRAAGGAPGDRLLAGLQGGLAALAGLAALSLPLLAGESWFAWQWLLKTAMAGFLALAGFAGGGIFALSAHLWQSQASDTAWRGGALYAVDLAGATVGALGFSLVVIPVWGLLPAFWLAAVLHLAGVALVLRPGRGEGQR